MRVPLERAAFGLGGTMGILEHAPSFHVRICGELRDGFALANVSSSVHFNL